MQTASNSRKGSNVSPVVVRGLPMWIGSMVAGYHIGKSNGRRDAQLVLRILRSALGLLIVACLRRTHEARVADEQKRLEIQGCRAVIQLDNARPTFG